MKMFLDYEELVDLTNRRRKDCQLSVLRNMGIEHRKRPDGSIAVLRSHIEKEFGGLSEKDMKPIKRIEPDWIALENLQHA